MAEYYFMSQLPSLDGISDQLPLPITEERFLELCHRFLGKKAQREIAALENKLCGMNLNAVIRMLGENSVEITSLRNGEKIAKKFYLIFVLGQSG